MVGLIAFIVALAALAAAAGHAGYLAMLKSAAQKRPGGQPVVEFTKKRTPVAGGALGVTLLGMLIALGASSSGGDIFAMLISGGGGFYALQSLQSTQQKFQKGDF